ncbi:hypothetical protein IW261DRAFT_797049 [Armillaria novae-zelandiae]|uniref:F-box domain-containing protein n=1 Tax=Armillaria novae-zelandiae TaxID=153914 RepID=A0AA39PLB2_9AGAR|nr:hypothetical protein IW261DRAFT_797049 [Armillaria novae-zelandiae]
MNSGSASRRLSRSTRSRVLPRLPSPTFPCLLASNIHHPSERSMPPPRKYRKAVDDKSEENIPVKDAVRTAKGGRRSAGKLSAFVELPLDILLEVFGLLNPLDLLRLARLSKDFRKVLMSKSTICAWKSARSNLEGFPGPYPGMSEPAWVNLAFMPECHYCTKTVRHPDMFLKTRLCPSCAKTRLVGREELMNGAPRSEEELIPIVFKLIPTHFTTYQRQRHRHLDLFALRSEYDAIQSQISAASDDELVQLELERSAFMIEHRKHAAICTEWHDQRVSDRQDEIDELKMNRKLAIYDKLKELGYEEDIKSVRYPDRFAEHALVKKNSPLTDRAWANIKSEMVGWAESMRVKRLAREREALINTRKSIAVTILRGYKNESTNYPLKHIFPTIADFCTFPPVREVLELPSEVVVNAQSFSEVLPQIPHLFRRWRSHVRGMLSQFILGPPSQTPPEDRLTPLKLARNVLICKSCSIFPHSSQRHRDAEDGDEYELAPLFYPQMFSHACTSLGYKRSSVTDETSNLVHEPWRWRTPWDTTWLAKNEKFKAIVETTIRMVELDPSTATVQDMDDADVRFKCLLCENEPIARYSELFILYNWREYAQHIFERHFWDSGRFSRHVEIFLSSVDIPPTYYNIRPTGTTVWNCVHCHDLPTERLGGYRGTGPRKVIDHVMIAHDIQEPQLDQDYYVAYGTPASAREGQMVTMHIAFGDLTADKYPCHLLDSYRGIWGEFDSGSDMESDSEFDTDSDG